MSVSEISSTADSSLNEDPWDRAERRAKANRASVAVLTACIGAYWIGPAAAALWLALVFLHERVLLPAAMKWLVIPNRGSQRALYWGAGVTLLSSTLYTMIWAPAFVQGAEGSGFFAGVYLACAMIHAITYSRRDPILVAASLIPPLAAALAAPLVVYGVGILALVMTAIVVALSLVVYNAGRDRMTLMATIKLNREQREAAEQASAAKSQFLAAMTHELRTPLNAVIGYSEMLHEDLSDEGHAGVDDAARIRRAALGLLDMVAGVLDFAQLDAGKLELAPRATEPLALLREAVERARPQAESRGTRIELDVDETIGERFIDPTRVQQVVQILLSNAVKFTESGCITVSAQAPDQTQLVVAVSDTGTGIQVEAQQRLFQPFVQAEAGFTRPRDGAGLGLALARRLTQSMGGDITLAETSSAGSRFTFRIAAPLAAD